MTPQDPIRNWSTRVRFETDARYAFRLGEILVKVDETPAPEAPGIAPFDPKGSAEAVRRIARATGIAEPVFDDVVVNGYATLRVRGDVPSLVRRLRGAGFTAQPNHALFASAELQGSPVYGSPVYGSPVYGSPVYGSPVYGSPVYGSPVYGSPVSGSPVYGSPVYGSPVYGSPVYGSPVYGSPVYGSGGAPVGLPGGAMPGCQPPDPCQCTPTGTGAQSLVYPNPVYAPLVYGEPNGTRYQRSGERPTQAKPVYGLAAPEPKLVDWDTAAVRVAVIDTGAPKNSVGSPLYQALTAGATPTDEPDVDGEHDLDPAAGHAMFIAGLIHQRAPRAAIRLLPGLSTYGDGDEQAIAATITDCVDWPEPPHLLNLSFGAYTLDDEAGALQAAIQRAQAAGIVVVAAAGNDGSNRPQYPAAFDGVVSVAALDDAAPASFSNWGSWVRACAPGVDLQSWFWSYNGRTRERYGADGDDFRNWAIWSGTSFAAPVVTGALAQVIETGLTPGEAVERVIDDAALFRLPCYGTVVNPPVLGDRPWLTP
ncbi:MAG: S8 family serine peptidase [Ilumatobacteraceae bacterium]